MKVSPNIRIIGRNFTFLSILKIFNIVSKFFLFIYLLKIFGPEHYGRFTWADSIIQYFIIVINFGFNVYAASLVVQFKSSLSKLNQLFSSIIQIKFILFIISIGIIFLLTFNQKIDTVSDILYILILTGIGEVLFPIWFFQGVENLRPATLIVLISRVILLLFTVIFVKDQNDLLLFATFMVVSNVLMGITGIIILKRTYGVLFQLQGVSTLVYYVRDAFMFFLGRFMSMAFTSISLFVIGYFLTMESVTILDWSLKIISVLTIPFEMLTQALFPTITRSKDIELLKKTILVSLITSIPIAIALFLFADNILFVLDLSNYPDAVTSLKILSIQIPFTAMAFLFGISSLVAFGFNKEYNYSLIISSIFFLFGIVALVILNKVTLINIVLLRVLSDVVLFLIRLKFTISLNIFTKR